MERDGTPPANSPRYGHSRPTASSALWGHLLSRHAPVGTTSRAPPPAAPVDRAAASTRILLHDTQAHLEKFTGRVDGMVAGLDNAQRELLTVQKLYHDEHEELVERMISLANRCQTELQKSIGSPAQVSQMSSISKDVAALETRLEALDQRVDSLNLASHAHTQALQNIQEQQVQILTALLPLLPLLQAVPVHIENARNDVKGSVSELCERISNQSHRHSFSRCGNARANASDSRTPARKKRRVESAEDAYTPGSGQLGSLCGILSTGNQSNTVNVSPAQPTALDASPAISLSETISRRLRPTRSSRPDHSRLCSPLTPANSNRASLHGHISMVHAQAANSSVLDPSQPRSHKLASTNAHGGVSRQQARLPSLAHSSAASPAIAGVLPSPHPDLKRTTTQSRSTSFMRITTQGQASPKSRSTRSPPLDATARLRASLSARSQSRQGVLGGGVCGLAGLIVPHTPRTGSRGDMQPPGGVPTSVGKPMSLKERRALLSKDDARNEGKRFILFDDEDEDDVNLIAATASTGR